MAKKISQIEGIGSTFAAKLEKAGVKSVNGLLEKGGSKAGRKAIASSSGLDEGKILNWVNMADLFRIKGVGSQFAELLKASGVDTVKELRNRNAANLHSALVDVQAKKKITKTVPGAGQVEDFINQAKKLDPKVSH